MAAGLGFIEFSTGDVLSAAAANGYLASQTVMVFADSAARTSAIASPQEGMFSFLKDTNATQFYDGAAWVNLDTTGMVNPMTTTGDVIYSSSGTTPARLALGTAGQVLTVNSGATAPEWATLPASSSGLVFIQSGTFSAAASVNVNTCFSSTYDNYRILVRVTGTSPVNGQVRYRMRSATTDNTTANYNSQRLYAQSTSVGGSAESNQTSGIIGPWNTALSFFATDMFSPFLAANTGYQTVSIYNETHIDNWAGAHKVASSFDGFTMFPDSGTITGEVWVYGYAK